jgi:hypothetical protein
MFDNNNDIKARDVAELDNQVSNYHTLGVIKSARGAAVIFLFLYIVLTLIQGFLGTRTFRDFFLYLVIYSFLALQIYRGKRWAIVTTIFVWTADSIYVFAVTGEWLRLVLWFIILAALIQSANVENRKLKNVSKR